MVDWIRHDKKENNAEVFHEESDNGTEPVWVAPTFKDSLMLTEQPSLKTQKPQQTME